MKEETYQDRFVKEYIELKCRYKKLHKMLVKYDAKTLEFTPTCPIEILKAQAKLMRKYLYILEVRAEIEKVKFPDYYVPTVNAERVIEEIVYSDLDDEIAEWSEDYLLDVKKEHIQELENELTKVFREWEIRHGYNNTSFVIRETINPFEKR